MFTYRNTLPCLTLALTLSAFALVERLPAQDAGGDTRNMTYSEVMNKIARHIVALASQESLTSVNIKQFTPPDSTTDGGAGIQKALEDEIRKTKALDISERALLLVSGEYEIDDREKSKLLVKLIIHLRSKKTGKSFDELICFLGPKANEEIVKVIGLNVDFGSKPHATKEERNEELRASFDNPPVYIPKEPSRAQVKENSRYAVEILVGKPGESYTPRPLTTKEGKLFVDLEPGEEYQLKLYNNTRLEAAAKVAIDGVDAYSFYEPAENRPTSSLILPKSTRIIEGWKRNASKANTFLVGKFDKDAPAAKALQTNAHTGTINVCFHPCWDPDKPPPEFKGSRDIATRFGREIEVETKIVKRAIGPLVEAVTIRYARKKS